ncbi:MAG: ABC transporter ATP-binding protein [Solirubrobacterales bacterium]
MALLELNGVTRRFGGLVAVDDVSASVEEDEIFGVIGPNGAGKTTLFSMIAGSLRPTSGEIKLDGTDLAGRPAHHVVRQGITRTHQVVKPFLNLTATENVEVGLLFGNRRVVDRRSEGVALLERCGLGDVADRLPGELTLSQRKRLEIARALGTGPRVLLLDEVVAGLNAQEAQGLVELIRELNREGLTILMIEHVMKAIMGLAGRILVLDGGAPLAQGTPREVSQDPAVVEAYLGRRAAKALEADHDREGRNA